MLNERTSAGEAPSHLPTQLAALDDALYGGVPLGAITELVGPAGLGKTQLCLMLSVFTTLPEAYGGLDGSVVYVDTENKFSSHRLVEIAQSRFPEQFADEATVQQLTSRVLVVSPSSATDLVDRLQALEAVIIDQRVRLLVVDSVAALVRSEFGRERLTERQQLLSKQASTLKYLAETFWIPVVVTNQVMTRGGSGAPEATYDFVPAAQPGEGTRGPGPDHTEPILTAALGTKWAHCVNIRLILEAFAGQRFLKIAKAPMAPCLAFAYHVTAAGIELAGEEVHEAEYGGQMTIRNAGSIAPDMMMEAS